MYPPQAHSHPVFHPPPPDYSSYVNGLFDHPLYQMAEYPYPPYSPAATMPPYANANNTSTPSNMFIQSFKNEDGSFNVNKALDTAGMMMNTVSQFSNIVKGVSGWLKA